jgi:hypothetical protein
MYENSRNYRVTPGIIVGSTRLVLDTLRGAGTPESADGADVESPYVLVEIAVPPDASQISIEVAGMTRRGLTVSAEGFVSFLLSRDIRDTAQTGTISYVSRGERVDQSLDLQRMGGRVDE